MAYGLLPWSQRMVHMWMKTNSLQVRTNRNQYKITRAERDILGKKNRYNRPFGRAVNSINTRY